MDAWHREIVELHEFFEAYFLGELDAADVGRLEQALAPDFTIVAPGGGESTRAETIAAIAAGHGHTSQLTIDVREARLLTGEHGLVIARYVEHQESARGVTDRLSTVVFTPASDAPNGLRWRTVHETWLPGEAVRDAQ